MTVSTRKLYNKCKTIAIAIALQQFPKRTQKTMVLVCETMFKWTSVTKCHTYRNYIHQTRIKLFFRLNKLANEAGKNIGHLQRIRLYNLNRIERNGMNYCIFAKLDARIYSCSKARVRLQLKVNSVESERARKEERKKTLLRRSKAQWQSFEPSSHK